MRTMNSTRISTASEQCTSNVIVERPHVGIIRETKEFDVKSYFHNISNLIKAHWKILLFILMSYTVVSSLFITEILYTNILVHRTLSTVEFSPKNEEQGNTEKQYLRSNKSDFITHNEDNENEVEYQTFQKSPFVSHHVNKFLNISAVRTLSKEMKSYEYIITPWNIRPDKPKSERLTGNDTKIKINCSMVVFIKSLPGNYLQRKIARWTWAGYELIDELRIEVIFVLGKTTSAEIQRRVGEESKKHGDILQTKTEENYKNLIHKTIAGMQYASEHFSPEWFYTSADDDIMPDLMLIKEKLFHLIKESKMEVLTDKRSNCTFKNVFPILCGFRYNVITLPRRNESSKWFVSMDTYPNKYYTPYCNGGWYTMSVKLATELYHLSKRTKYFWIDDVWITGLLRLKYFSSLAQNCYLDDIQVGLWTYNSQYLAFSTTGSDDDLMHQWAQFAAKIFKSKIHIYV